MAKRVAWLVVNSFGAPVDVASSKHMAALKRAHKEAMFGAGAFIVWGKVVIDWPKPARKRRGGMR